MLAADALMDGRQDTESNGFMAALDPVLSDAYRLAYGLLRNADDAGDAVQEAALSAWRHRRSFRAVAPIRPWFLAIVANQCRHALKNPWWSVRKRPDVSAITQNDDFALEDDEQELRRGLLQLSERDRLVLVLRYYLDLPFDEVAATLHISAGAARVRASRALARLRPIVDTPKEPSHG